VDRWLRRQATDIEIAPRETLSLKRRIEESSPSRQQELEKVTRTWSAILLSSEEAKDYASSIDVIEHR